MVLWRGAFGLLPSEREIVWRLPLSYGDVRKLELQVWDGASLLKREELMFPTGISSEPTSKLTMSRGPHRAVMIVSVAGASAPLSYTVDFDPRDDATIVVTAPKPVAGH